MDFHEFRSQVIRVPFTFEGVEFWVGYRPREIVEEDLEYLAQLQHARVAEVSEDALAQAAPPPPNRAARRRAEKAEAVARSTPTAKARAEHATTPTLIDHMKRLIADWSLTWDGEPWEPSEAHFRLIEPLMRTVMIGAIVEDYLDRPNRMTSSSPSSAETASGPTGQTSASEPSSGEAASSPGSTPDFPTPEPARSGVSG